MKTVALIIALLAPGLLTAASRAQQVDRCLACHETLGDAPSAAFKKDIHHAKGLTCAGCHGGNPNAEEMEQAMDTTAGFMGVPKGDQISQACARCHSDSTRMQQLGSSLPTNQFANLTESVHGMLSINGSERVVQCISCHGAHGIVSVKNPASPVYPLNVVRTCTKCHADPALMRAYNPSLPVDQLEKYRTSVHGIKNAKGDPKTAECASCHGSHDIRSAKDVRSSVYATNIPATCSHCHSDQTYMKEYGIPTDQFAKFSRSVHGIALLGKRDVSAPACNDCHGNHGAAPPGVESVSKVCGTCHALNADLFASSPHKKAFDEKNLPECETCHGNHDIIAASDKLLGAGPDATCGKCHSASQHPRGYAVARMMRLQIDSLEAGERLADSLVTDAEQKGMEISEARFKLRDAHQARLQSRTMVHSVDEDKFRPVVTKGISVASLVAAEGRQAIAEYYFRRFGLGIATLIITIVALSLYLTVRRIERRQRSAGSAQQG